MAYLLLALGFLFLICMIGVDVNDLRRNQVTIIRDLKELKEEVHHE